MPKKPRVRTFMDNQHVNGSKTLLEASGQYFCHIFGQSDRKLRRKTLF